VDDTTADNPPRSTIEPGSSGMPAFRPSSGSRGTPTDTLAPALQKVLVVDDCRLIRALVQARLKDEPIELHFATNGVEGLGLARSLLPDLILLDVVMPDLDGPEVIRRLKSDPATLQIPVIFLTGADSTEAKVLGFELGAVDYVTKPFDPTELKARVRSTLKTKYLMDLLAQRAMIDGLTGLWNRAYFNERVPAEISLARRMGNQVSLVLFDIDYFKKLNDAHGHPFGDEVLRAVSRAMSTRLRSSDVACRYGGEEFAIILPNTDAPRAGILAEDIRSRIADLAISRGKEQLVTVTASFGITDLGRDQDGQAMLQAADDALYEAKRSGRNRVVTARSLLAAGMQASSPGAA
jgi:two-component system cell cycle response regulator